MPRNQLPTRRTTLKLLGGLPLVAMTASGSATSAPPVRDDYDLIPDPSLRGLEQDARILVADTLDYWTLYPTVEPLSIARLERLPDRVGLAIDLADHGRPATRITVDGEGDGAHETQGATLRVWFPDKKRPETQNHIVRLHAMGADGEPGPSHRLHLMYVSKERDAVHGREMFSRVIVRDTDLSVSYSMVDDWVINQPDSADRAFAQEAWGPALPASGSGAERALALTRRIIAEFEPFRGTPSDAMNRLHPFRQYERVIADRDRVWCANICEVLAHAANALDLPCRLIRMRHTYREARPDHRDTDYEVLTGPGHTVPEIFDADSNRWLLIDPTLRVLGFHDGAGHSLNLNQAHRHINQPDLLAEMSVDQYDPATDRITRVRLLEHERSMNLRSYLRREQRFYYFKRKPDRAG